jgi:hypothetical protein
MQGVGVMWRPEWKLSFSGKVILALYLFSGPLNAEGLWCKYRDLAPKEDMLIPIQIRTLLLTSAPQATIGQAVAVNRNAKSIKYYLIIVEFESKDRRLTSVPLYNVDRMGTSPFQFQYMQWLYAHDKQPNTTLVSERPSDISFSSAMIMLSCPATARLASVRLTFEDGSLFEYESPSLNLWPVLVAAPLDYTTALAKPRIIKGSVDFNAQGSPKISSSSIDDTDFLRHLMLNWIFLPPVAAAQKGNYRLNFMLSVGKLQPVSKFIHSQSLNDEQPFVALYVISPSGFLPGVPKKWTVQMGNKRVSDGKLKPVAESSTN